MTTTKDQTVAAGHSVDPARWQAGLEELLGRVAGRFARVELRRRARAFVRGLLSDLPRKNCWTIAEHAGDASPDGMQHLLGRAVWDHDKVRDDVRDYVTEHLGDPEAVLVVDETGDLKKGTTTVGVQRQYTGTAGRIENAQVAVYLVYATDAGHGVIDRELYLPRSWTDDPERLQAAGVPDQAGFATKPALATKMIIRALDAGVPAAWVAGDEVYGANREQAGRHWLMIRRNRKTGELAYYRCYTPRPTPLAVLVRVAGRRWSIEETFQTGKGLCGLDQHQVRCWRSWYRWVTLAMLAHAFLVVAALAERTRRSVIAPTGCAGRCGDADIRPAPVPAITDDRPPGNHEDHDLRLEY